MPNHPALTSTVRAFDIALQSAANLNVAVTPFCARTYDGILERPLHPNQARRVVALSFLAATAAWEEFLGAIFVRYVAGAPSPGGYRPPLLLGPACSLEHAYNLVSGTPDFDPESRFLNWGPDETLGRAKLFFPPGSPFERAISGAKRQLKDAAVIRNRVAHSSPKSRSDFVEVARRLLQRHQLTQGYSVGDLLLERPRAQLHPNAGGSTVFEAYLNLFIHLREVLAP
jgi:hypothetical protein